MITKVAWKSFAKSEFSVSKVLYQDSEVLRQLTFNSMAFSAFKISSSRVKIILSFQSWLLAPGNKSQYRSEVEIQIWTDRNKKHYIYCSEN